MSTTVAPVVEVDEGVADLTPLGMRIEFLRIERAISKQRLAQRAGTSRQQLWRVMTGKSELTSSFRERLASALAIEAASLVSPPLTRSATQYTPSVSIAPVTVAEYLTDAEHLAVTLRTLPSGDHGRRLKRTLLNAVEDLAVESGRALPLEYSEIHRRVLAGEL
ncbi:MAG: hypothetical protein JWM95_3423 [Gemmatimonadetes bacterium]|nr:hypothetical protein [Gemmatimonadota bacterium]